MCLLCRCVVLCACVLFVALGCLLSVRLVGVVVLFCVVGVVHVSVCVCCVFYIVLSACALVVAFGRLIYVRLVGVVVLLCVFALVMSL